MNDFEQIWRTRVKKEVEEHRNEELSNAFHANTEDNPVSYTNTLIKDLKDHLLEDKIKQLFCNSACHFPHNKLEPVKEVWNLTHSLEATHKALELLFKKDIKQYKQLTDEQIEDILQKGWGLAGVIEDGYIIATKIPSQFHEYFKETDPMKQAYYYCHCPRVKQELLNNKDLDSIYCNCGGGFYQDVWQYITSKRVDIEVLTTLFNDDPVCSFSIRIQP